MECEQTTKEVEDDEESLREAACIGDMDLVRRLVDNGVSVNSQNDMNGWSCLHWACKRNRTPIVAYLLEAGADAEALTAKGERAVDLTHNPDIRAILGCESSANDIVEDSSLPITPNYISNPPFPYSAPTENGVAGNPDRELKSPQYAVDRESGHDDSTSPQLAGLKDKEVARLTDYQELELVVGKHGSLFSQGRHQQDSDIPCYNKKALELTY
uniref:ankyrin repeat domain-containing protein 40-like isoform X11 n=1 Tax=Myxine glutinosa TaxID=7769 RepID=UPI00358DE85B